ncbi:uncharacterized protein LOC123560406 [Mercenaria mercenaria]|uniref:uncharacterized protein LOC123560406 n=1 Tax=Mercenaria mercenaria TaxID=6596 RepID=UPI00234EEAF6|nr:uncharacterized protein LOC123560406 [Mercenaria mercenaria]
MKYQVYNLLQSSVLFSLCGNAGSPLHVYEQLLAYGHLEKALQAPVGGFSLPTGMSIHYSSQDSKMRDSVEMLRIMFDQVATIFYKAEVLEGSNLLNYYNKINSVTSVTDLDVHAMSLTLNGAKQAFKKVEDNMIALQGEVHFLIETVRRRIQELRNEIQENEVERQTLDEKMKILGEKIRDYDNSARDSDRQARYMEAEARRMAREADEAAAWGGVELVGAAVSGVIGLFTGGVGFAVPFVVLGGLGVKNVRDVAHYRSRAQDFREDAYRSRNRADELRRQVRLSERSVIQLKENAEYIQRQIIQLESSQRRINELSKSLHGSVGATNEVILMLQNIVVAVTNAELSAKSLQDLFKHLPQVMEKASVSQLKTTKSAWTSIQELLLIHHKLLT